MSTVNFRSFSKSCEAQNYLKQWETWQIDSSTVDGLEGKELV